MYSLVFKISVERPKADHPDIYISILFADQVFFADQAIERITVIRSIASEVKITGLTR